MVLKTFIHYLINKYLKNYVERFDHEKVKLNLKSGQYYSCSLVIINSLSFIGNIFLENLRLKPEALVSISFQQKPSQCGNSNIGSFEHSCNSSHGILR